MSIHHHTGHAAENATMTVATLATASGSVDSVRETFHMLAGIWGDLAGILVSVLTVIWWALKVTDHLLARWRARRAPLPFVGGPIGSPDRTP